MSKPKISTLKVAAAYIGTVVGAGFASGQEILQFFGFFGAFGIIGIIVSGLLFSFYGYLILKLGRKLRAESHLPVIRYIGGKFLGTIIDYVITFFLFGAVTVMAAGAGALLQEQLGLPELLGSGFLMIVALLTVLLGISGVINAISIVTPFLLIAVFVIAFLTIYSTGFDFNNLTTTNLGIPPVPFWSIAAILYVSYNLVMAVAILAPLGKETDDQKTLKKGAVIGGFGLAIGAGAIYLAVLVNMPQAGEFSIPMIFVVSQISPLIQLAFAVVIFAEVYTTAVGSLYGFAARIIPPNHPASWKYIVGTSIVAYGFSQLGFTNLVRYLFPAVGAMGILMLGGLSWVYLKEMSIYMLFKRVASQPAYKKKTNKLEEPKKSVYKQDHKK